MSDKQQATGTKSGGKTTVAIVLVTSLFFIWGLTMNLVNALDTPMANYMELTQTESSLLQVAYYGAYFLMAIPASLVARRFGYKGGVICGLCLFVIGSFITVPAMNAMSYGIFLFAMFVIALGAATLETNCNPYITKLGDEKHESTRLNLAQSFNGVGNIVGPLILGQVIGTTVASNMSGFKEARAQFFSSTQQIYIVIGIVVAVVLCIFIFVKLPEPPGDVEEKKSGEKQQGIASSLVHKPHFVLGVIAEFVFIGLQVAGMALFSAFAIKHWTGMTAGMATSYLAILSLLFTIGRFVTTPLMNKFEPGKILGTYMIISAVLMVVAGIGITYVSVIAFLVAYLFISIGYPTIYTLTLKGIQGSAAKAGSSALTMSIVGAALIPLLLSAVSDAASIEIALFIMAPGYLFVAWYALKGSQIGLGSGKSTD
jgi:FHS family L-fucose permease-like MFS transporter